MTATLKRKQVILIRKDLKMRRGKEIAQGSHASMEFLVSQLRGGQTAITEEELISFHEKAQALGLKSHIIRDSGRTEFGGVPTLTACAIGPAIAEHIDEVTGDLTPY